VSHPRVRFRSGTALYVFRGHIDRTGKHAMEHLTADDICPPETTTATPDRELDHALARAVRRLIARARDRDPAIHDLDRPTSRT